MFTPLSNSKLAMLLIKKELSMKKATSPRVVRNLLHGARIAGQHILNGARIEKCKMKEKDLSGRLLDFTAGIIGFIVILNKII